MATLSLILSLLLPAGDNYMRMLQPRTETAQDKEVIKVLAALDQALAGQKTAEVEALTAKLRAMPGAKKSIVLLTKSSDVLTRALAVFGCRMLPLKRAWQDNLQFLIMDGEAGIRRQVLLYVAQEPAGISLASVQLALSDGAAQVRIAAVGAILKTARRPAEAAELFEKRLAQEQDPAVISALRLGFTALGLPTPPAK
jgi:hypothetical protein